MKVLSRFVRSRTIRSDRPSPKNRAPQKWGASKTPEKWGVQKRVILGHLLDGPWKKGPPTRPIPSIFISSSHPACTHVLTRPAESLPGCIQRDPQKRSRAKEAFGEKSASALPTNRRPPDQTCSEPPKNMVFHQNPHLKTNDILDTNRMWFFDVANTRLLIISCHEVIMRCVR